MNQEGIYQLTAIVVKADMASDLVTVEDTEGELWQFYGADGWQTSDPCTLVMGTSGTETTYDDCIILALHD